MDLKIIPSIALKGGKPFFVYSRSGEGNEPDEPEDIEDAVEDLGEDHGCVHVLDMDGIERDSLNYDLIADLSAVATLWLECGSSDTERVMDAMITGAEYVVIGTRFLRKLKDLKGILDITENALFAIEWDGSLMSSSSKISKMGIEALGREVKELGIEKVLFTDVERIKGKTGSVNYVAISDLVSSGVEVYVSGGCVLGDRDALERLKVSGMVIEAGLLPKVPKKGESEEGER
jgi:phosphoribosylformimino-5-aminoimidazole carboxamide ribonucleotide (ProFAR) isomerase